MSSFRAALLAGVKMIEFDVTLTRDKIPIVIHDRMLDRTTNGKGKVKRFTCEEIRELDAGSWFSPKFAGEKVPLFSEVLDEFGGKVQLHIEIKRNAIRFWPVRGIEAIVVEEVRKRNLDSSVVISSFSERAVRRVKRLASNIEAAVIYSELPNEDPSEIITRTSADAIHLSIRNLDQGLVEKIRKKGIVLRVYTVNEEDEIRRMANWGVDGIFTNEAARALALVKS
jgi:glycerophosphoryl diester phosphodiesterase